MSDEDRPWQRRKLTPPPLDQYAPGGQGSGDVATVEEAAVVTTLHDLVACLISNCEFDGSWKRRTPQAFRRALSIESARWNRGTDWREDFPPLVRLVVARELRNRAAELSSRRGPMPSNAARIPLEMACASLRATLEAAGQHDKASQILEPGQAPTEWDDGPAAPTGLNTAMGLVAGAAEIAGIDLPPGSLKRAADAIRRAERRRRES